MECFPTFLGSKLPYICQHILAFLAAQNRQLTVWWILPLFSTDTLYLVPTEILFCSCFSSFQSNFRLLSKVGIPTSVPHFELLIGNEA